MVEAEQIDSALLRHALHFLEARRRKTLERTRQREWTRAQYEEYFGASVNLAQPGVSMAKKGQHDAVGENRSAGGGGGGGGGGAADGAGDDGRAGGGGDGPA